MAVAAAHEQCPWCGSTISHATFLEMQARIRAEEKRQFETAQAEAREKVKAERAELERKARAKDEALKETTEKLQLANAERAAFDLKLKDATAAAATAARKAAAEQHAQQLAAERARARELYQAELDKKLRKLAADATRDKQGLQKKVDELQRKLDAKTAHDLGEGAEIDVFEELKAAFGGKGDQIVRVPKGEAGADVIHTVKYKGAVCGRIIVDSKNRKNWQSSYATKLHGDMVDAEADYGILATVAFPKDHRELCEHDGVLLVHPGRVAELVGILRRALIKMFQAKLSTDQRAEKKAKLYQYITSEACRQRLAESGNLAASLLELEVEEKKQHDRIWKTRGATLRKIQTVSAEVETEISAIVDGIGS